MKIDKVMNNNVVSSIDEDGQEIIVVGTGIGFQGKEGKVVDKKKIQKIFRLEDPKMIRKLKEILQDLPMEQFEISTAIIEHAKQSLGTELNENIYVTVTDHIHFAIQRYEDHMNFPNPMLREVRLFYEKEFALGEYALGMIKQRLNISLPLDDAASIALHIVSAEFDTRVKDTLKITEFLEDVMEQIKNYFHLEIDTQSLSYERFITHLKFLSRKLFASERMDDMNNDVQEMIQKICPEEYQCAGYIKTFIEAGAVICHPCCGLCCGMPYGLMTDDERILLTANRNFIGRQGTKKTLGYLSSPTVAAATAVMGVVTDPADLPALA